MSCCCTNTLNAGCFCVASGLVLNFEAPADALVYKLVADYWNSQIQIRSEPTTMGDPVGFDTSALNITYKYTAQLLDNLGAAVTLYDSEGNAYDCIQFEPRAYGAIGITRQLYLASL